MAKRSKKTTRTMTSDEANALVDRAVDQIVNSIEWDWSGWDGGVVSYAEWKWLRENVAGKLSLTATLDQAPKLVIDISEDGDED